MSIKKLDEQLVSDICINQVIVDLSVCVKELLENSLDAGAKDVEILFFESGFHGLHVNDNGSGISRKNLDAIVKKGSTSKLTTEEDLNSILSYGFRGEALNAIARMADLQIVTRTEQEDGWHAEYDKSTNNLVVSPKQVHKVGTSVMVSRLFENYQIRYNEFKKNLKTHYKKALSLIESYGLIRTEVRIHVCNIINQSKREMVYSNLGPKTTLLANIQNQYGSKIAETLGEITHVCDKFKLLGYASKALLSGSMQQRAVKKDQIMVYVNKRPVHLPRKIVSVLDELYKQYNSNAKYTFIASLEMSPEEYDINLSVDKFQVYFKELPAIAAEVRKLMENFLESEKAVVKSSAEMTQKSLSFDNTAKSSKRRVEAMSSSSKQDEMKIEKPPSHSILDDANAMLIEEVAVVGSDDEVYIDQEKPLRRSTLNRLDGENQLKRPPPCELAELAESQPILRKLDEEQDNQDRKLAKPISSTASQPNPERKSFFNPSLTKTALQSQTTGNLGSLLFKQFKQNYDAGIGTRQRHGGASSLPKFSYRSSAQEPIQSTSGAHSLEQPDIVNQASEENDADTTFRVTDALTFISLNSKEKLKPGSVEYEQKDLEDLEATSGHSTKQKRLDDVPSSNNMDFDEDCLHPSSSQASSNIESESLSQKLDSKEDLAKPLVSVIKVNSSGDVVKDQASYSKSTSILSLQLPVPSTPSQKPYKQERSSSKILTDAGVFIKQLTYAQDFDQNNQQVSQAFRKELFPVLEIAGQFNKGFIVTYLPQSGELFLIDQHASNEKETFEYLSNNYKVQSQALVAPRPVDVTFAQKQAIKDSIHMLKKNGYTVDEQSLNSEKNEVKLSTTPSLRAYTLGPGDFQELVELISESQVHSEVYRTTAMKKYLASRACRTSVMIGQTLEMQRMKKIVSDLGSLQSPWNCPHGRPTLIKLGNLQSLPKKIEHDTKHSRKCAFNI